MATSENPPDPPFFQRGGGTYKSTILTVFHPLDYAMSLKNVLALLIFLLGVSPIHAAQPLTKVIMTSGSFSEREASMYVAQDQGFFRRYGLDLTFVTVRSGPVGMAALASGESQFHSGSATGATLGSAAEGMDIVYVAGIINKLIGNKIGRASCR